MSTWLAGFEHDESIVGAGGGTYVAATPWRFVIHTTEGSWESAMSVFRSRMVAPHMMYDPLTRRRVQFIDLDRSAYALRHQGPETNRAHCLQVELVGLASHPFTGDLADRIGTDLLAPVLAAKPITTRHPTFWGPDCGWTLASSSARQRMGSAEWLGFDGICGHQHVPGNEHWDPGAIDIDRIIRAATNTGGFTVDDDAKAYFFKQAVLTLKTEDRLTKLIKRKFAREGVKDAETDARLAELAVEIADLEAKINALG